MNIAWQEAHLYLELDPLATLAVSLLLFFLGRWITKKFPLLEKYCIPAAVVGGTTFALINLCSHQFSSFTLTFDNSLQIPAMTGFFACTGLGIAKGGIRRSVRGAGMYFTLCVALVVCQNIISIGLAWLLGLHPALGLMVGSSALVGGHGTVIPFGQSLLERGIENANYVGLAAATFGLVSGSAIGGPLATLLIRRHKISIPGLRGKIPSQAKQIDPESTPIILSPIMFYKHVALVAVVMGMSSLFASAIEALLPSLVIPASVAGMLLGLLFGYTIMRWQWMSFDGTYLDLIGDLMLIIFLTESSMSLQLWQLFSLALPLITILAVEVVFIIAFSYFIVFPAMAKTLQDDYESAVIVGGLCGHGMGAAPNAIANMDALVDRYGPAPNAYLIVPLVGGFLVDLVNIPLLFILLNLMA